MVDAGQSHSLSSCLSWLLDFGGECRDDTSCAIAEWNGVEGKGVSGKWWRVRTGEWEWEHSAVRSGA